MLSPALRNVVLKPPQIKVRQTHSANSATDASSYSFTNCEIGDGAADRLVVVGLFLSDDGAGSPTPSSVLINGVAATSVVASTGTSLAVYLQQALVPTGNLVTISFNTSAGCERAALVVWTLRGWLSQTAFGSIGGAGNPATLALPCPAGGVALGFVALGSASSFVMTGITEEVDSTVETNTYAGGSTQDCPTSGETRTIVFTGTGTARGVAASWR